EMAEGIAAVGGNARYVELHSPYGHDAFLKEWEQLDALLRPFLAVPPSGGDEQQMACEGVGSRASAER
ncbi:MAG TPA: hypothetical protein VH590_18595, partial [Ktedonobacterales bacterium]